MDKKIRARARTRLAVAAACLTLPAPLVVQAVERTPPAELVALAGLVLVLAFGAAKVHAWVFDTFVMTHVTGLRVVANVEMHVPPWKAVTNTAVRRAYATHLTLVSIVLVVIGVAMTVSTEPRAFPAGFVGGTIVLFMFVVRPTEQPAPPPPPPDPWETRWVARSAENEGSKAPS